MHAIPTLLAAAALGAALFSNVQDPERSVRKTPPPKLVLEAGEYEVAELIARSARFLKRTDLLSPDELKTRRGGAPPTVTLAEPLALAPGECDEVIERLAFVHDLVRVPLHEEKGLHLWVSLNGHNRDKVRRTATKMPADQVLKVRRSKLPVLTAVPLEHVSAQITARSLAPVFTSSRYGFAMSHAGNAVVVTGCADQVANAIDLLREIDQPLKNPESKWQQRIDAMQAEIESLRAEVRKLRKAAK